MTALPASTDFTNSSTTEAQFKTAITNQRDYLAGLFGTDGLPNTALAALGAIFGALDLKTANHNVTVADKGHILQCSNTITISFDTASTLGANFSVIVTNAGSGVVTLNPSGSELIDGQLTKTLDENQSAIIYCDGTNFHTVGGSGNGGLGGMQAFTSNGTFTVPTGVKTLKVTVVGGGGNGSNATYNNGTYNYWAGHGGGAGGMAQDFISGLTAGDTVAVTVGGAGGTSSFGTYLSATGGGSAGLDSAGGGGAGANGIVNTNGGGGGFRPEQFQSGAGGASYFGGNGKASANDNGQAGANGGGGAGAGGGGAAYTGGAGGAGLVIVEW